MASHLKKQMIYVNSRNRMSGTDSNFSYKFDLNYQQYTHVAVLQASIPKSYYLIEDGANTFILQEGATSFFVSMPFGNYTRNSFVSQLQTSLNLVGNWTYTVNLSNYQQSAETGLLYFTVVNNNNVQPAFIFGDTMFEPMGFDANSSNSFVGNILNSVNVINLQKESTVFIHSNICANETDNVLQEVCTSNTSDYGYLIYQNPNVHHYSKTITNVNNIYNFYLTDENGREINLHGRNWVMTMCLYHEDDMNAMVKKYIQWRVSK